MKTKQCTKCQTIKSADLFNKNVLTLDGLHSYCRECNRAYNIELKTRGPITPEEWENRRKDRLIKRQEAKDTERLNHFQDATKGFTGDSKAIPENPNYIALSDGRVWSLRSKRFLATANHHLGYLFIGKFIINGKKKFCLLHQVIAHAFIPNPDPVTLVELNHIDGNKHNNNKENLEWVSRKGNMQAAWELGLMENVRNRTEERKGIVTNPKLNEESVREIRRLRADGSSVKDLSQTYNIGETAIYKLIKGESWKHVA